MLKGKGLDAPKPEFSDIHIKIRNTLSEVEKYHR